MRLHSRQQIVVAMVKIVFSVLGVFFLCATRSSRAGMLMGGGSMGGMGGSMGGMGAGAGYGLGMMGGSRGLGKMGMGMGGMGMGGMGMSKMGMGGMGMGGMGMGGMGMGGMGMGGMGMGVSGGETAGGSSMEGVDKRFNDVVARNSFGRQGGQFDQGMSGFSKGEGAVKDAKGESGFYSGTKGMNNMLEDGSVFKGGQYFGRDGLNRDEEGAKRAHKKGHTVKGFKKSHQSDEASNTEEIYDEEHDEADRRAAAAHKGQAGQAEGGAFAGGKADAQFAQGQGGGGGGFEKAAMAGGAAAHQGGHGSNKFAGGGATFGANNGGSVDDVAAHQGHNSVYKHVPVHF